MMENYEAGLAFLDENFGKRPHVGWQLDPFGHSAVTPYILETLGFDTLFMTRVGTVVKQNLRENGHLRFIWKDAEDSRGVFVTVN